LQLTQLFRRSHRRICTGSVDRDTSQPVTLNLALALNAQVAAVNYAMARNQTHSGWYDKDEFAKLVLFLPGCGGK